MTLCHTLIRFASLKPSIHWRKYLQHLLIPSPSLDASLNLLSPFIPDYRSFPFLSLLVPATSQERMSQKERLFEGFSALRPSPLENDLDPLIGQDDYKTRPVKTKAAATLESPRRWLARARRRKKMVGEKKGWGGESAKIDWSYPTAPRGHPLLVLGTRLKLTARPGPR